MLSFLEGFSWSCDWPQLWGKWNWQTFRFIHASVEIDSLLGQFELDAALLGFGLRWVWVFDPESEMRIDLAAMIDDPNLMENAKCWIPYPEWVETKAAADWAKANGWQG